MAQSVQAPFRREFQISGGNYLGSPEGQFIGNINSLRVELMQTIGDILVQAKIGLLGTWVTVYKNNSTSLAPDLDVRAFEYVRVYVVPGSTTPINCLIVGSLALPAISVYTTEQGHRDHIITTENNIILKDILQGLNKLCFYFETLIEDKE